MPISSILLRALFGLACVSLVVNAHGTITSHNIRMPGEASKKVCGQAFNDHWNGVYNENDMTGPLYSYEPRDRTKNWPSDCKWYLCQGKQFEDNQENVYTFPAGSPLHLQIFIRAAHEGTANVSVVDLEKNEVIPGAQMKYWGKGYAALKTIGDKPWAPSDQVDFVVDMPQLDGRCSQPGKCAVQFWWWGKESARDQTFESCIDFVQPNSLVALDDGPAAQITFGAPAQME